VTRAAVLACTTGLLAACSGGFRVDHSVTITAPAPMAVVAVPFTAQWSGGPGPYAVFVDQAPIGAGHSLRDVADDQCKRQTGCPDAAYLATRNIYLAPSGSVDIAQLPIVAGTEAKADHPTHTLTVVRIDDRGHRRGDAAWTVEFRA
jgi:hypothetical protein